MIGIFIHYLIEFYLTFLTIYDVFISILEKTEPQKTIMLDCELNLIIWIQSSES